MIWLLLTEYIYKKNLKMLIFSLLVIKISSQRPICLLTTQSQFTKHQFAKWPICQFFFPSVSFTTSFLPLSPLASQLGLANIHLACFKIQMARISGTSASGLLMGPHNPSALPPFIPAQLLPLAAPIHLAPGLKHLYNGLKYFFFLTENVVNWPLPTALRKMVFNKLTWNS